MFELCRLIFGLITDQFRSRADLEAEVLVLRQQMVVLRRKELGRLPIQTLDRMVLDWVCQLFPNAISALAIVRPDTVIRWHRAGFRSYWCWKSKRRSGRPVVSAEVRQLIREMSIANALWGAPRIHGELLKLSILGGPASPNTWRGGGGRHPRVGRHSFAIMRMGSRQWTCLWCRQSRFGFCTVYWS